PRDIVDAYNEEQTPAARLKRMFDDFGKQTIELMAEGALCMADIWASAWKEGGGAVNVPASNLGAQDQAALQSLYVQPSFFPSMSLELMIPLLTVSPSPQAVPHLVASRSQRQRRRVPVVARNGKRANKRRAVS